VRRKIHMKETITDTISKNLVTGLLAVPLVLMGLGDLRNVVTPLGYWALWGGWGVATTLLLSPWRGPAAWREPPRWVLLSYGALVAGMVISGLINQDRGTIYQAAKIVVICGLFLAMWLVALRIKPPQVLTAMYMAVTVSILCFFVPIMTGGYMESLDSRQGSIFALFGVMWKAGTFFLPVFVADLIVRPKAWIQNSLAIGACLFLVLLDGSRTGQLLIIIIFAGSSAMLWWRGDLGQLLRRPQWIVLIACCLGGLLLANAAIKNSRNSATVASAQATVVPVAAQDLAPVRAVPAVAAGTASVAARIPARAESSAPLVAMADSAFTPLVKTRLGSGDEARVKLLLNSLKKVPQCLPFGCGFGSTATEIGTDHPVYVHNAYLAALVDFGVLGLAGMLGFLLCSLVPLRPVLKKATPAAQAYYVAAMAGSALAYGTGLMLHTFTTEMSEWGYLIFALAFAWSFLRWRDG
jgi:hypothetical protein